MNIRRKSADAEARRARQGRFGFRIDLETKELIERAAELERRSLTDFCLSAVSAAARETIAKHETLQLSARDREVFFRVLMNPPRPNARLRRALELERKLIAR